MKDETRDYEVCQLLQQEEWEVLGVSLSCMHEMAAHVRLEYF